MTRFRHGWKPDRCDPRDKLYRRLAHRAASVPDHVDLRGACSPIEDQGDLGSCTAHALAGAVEFLELKAGLPIVRVSRLFIYFQERDLEGDTAEDNGAEIRDGVKALNQRGVCPESDWPYDISRFSVKPTDLAYSDALQHTIQSYHRLLTIGEMLQCLAEGFPFVFGFTVFSGFESDAVRQTGIVNLPGPDEEGLGGHAVMAVGYDLPAKRIIVRNSWGPLWGQAGYFTIPFEYLETMADDFWVLKQ